MDGSNRFVLLRQSFENQEYSRTKGGNTEGRFLILNTGTICTEWMHLSPIMHLHLSSLLLIKMRGTALSYACTLSSVELTQSTPKEVSIGLQPEAGMATTP